LLGQPGADQPNDDRLRTENPRESIFNLNDEAFSSQLHSIFSSQLDGYPRRWR
jgi:hypothetical protein